MRLYGLIIGLYLVGFAWGQIADRILLIAVDNQQQPVPGIRFAFEGVQSQLTTTTGATEVELPPGYQPGQKIKLLLLPDQSTQSDWFLINTMVNIPLENTSAEVVLFRRSEFRDLAADYRDSSQEIVTGDALVGKGRPDVLSKLAPDYGLTSEQLESAIQSFAETDNEKDQGIAAYLAGEYQTAEVHLQRAADGQLAGIVETLRYLGASQYEQAKYHEAVKTFSKANVLVQQNAELINWLGLSFYKLADWEKAEQLMRCALSIDKAMYGQDHTIVAVRLNNLALLLQATNRLSEAEPLMRRALLIDEAMYGSNHPTVAIRLNNLAFLLQVTNRLDEAEPLMRRALSIDESSYGLDHPNVARDLSNLASLLQMTNRLSEAEPLIRRALLIDEATYDSAHPNIAIRLNNLAQLLQATKRLNEAESLMRRALLIDESSYELDHPNVARDLSNLASLMQMTNRLSEAEPLVRRALLINESSFGLDHPSVARDLNNLAQLLKVTNRLNEAEPLMRRAIIIFVKFRNKNNYIHPNFETAVGNYREILNQQGKSDDEIKDLLKTVKLSNKDSRRN